MEDSYDHIIYRKPFQRHLPFADAKYDIILLISSYLYNLNPNNIDKILRAIAINFQGSDFYLEKEAIVPYF